MSKRLTAVIVGLFISASTAAFWGYAMISDEKAKTVAVKMKVAAATEERNRIQRKQEEDTKRTTEESRTANTGAAPLSFPSSGVLTPERTSPARFECYENTGTR